MSSYRIFFLHVSYSYIICMLFFIILSAFCCFVSSSTFTTYQSILPNVTNIHFSLFEGDSTHSLSKFNRCSFYPRCLLFSCCNNGSALRRISSYLNKEGFFPNHFSCMKSKQCDLSVPLSVRLQTLPIINTTLSVNLINDLLRILPPTSSKVLKELSIRKEFKIIYLVQGDYFSKLESCYSQFEELIYLSFKEKIDGSRKFL